MITKPMLAGKCTDTSRLKYPVLCTPKLDGVRALVIKGVLVSRNWKPIPNNYVRTLFSDLPDGCDGELITDNGTVAGKGFNDTQGDVMRKNGEPKVFYHIFDYVVEYKTIIPGYYDRMRELKRTEKIAKYVKVRLILPILINNEAELLAYEQKCLTEGYEGVMIRSIDGPYKEGRSTEKEGYLLKLKRFEDGEAKIVGFEEKQHNENVAEKDAFGRTKRGSSMAGLVGAGTLGKILVVDVKTNVDFGIGTGFDDAMRQEIWNHKSKYMGKIVKYKHQACGSVDRPRFPVFLGFRDKRDMSC